MNATDKQIALMRDIRMKGAINALLFSAHAAEGPGLREAGLIDGIGDSTALSEIGIAALAQADSKVLPAKEYRGWTISYDPPPIPMRNFDWRATGPNYDASYEGAEDGWVDNGEKANAPTRDALIAEIDAWFEENAK